MSLQITSMADIFIIILVFLIKGYASGAMNITPSGGMRLPAAKTGESTIEALKIEVSETTVQVEGKPVATLTGFRFDPADLEKSGASRALSVALDTERQRQLLIAKSNSDVKVDPKIVIVADQRVPYITVKSVLAAAALHGYTDFKLAVVKGN